MFFKLGKDECDSYLFTFTEKDKAESNVIALYYIIFYLYQKLEYLINVMRENDNQSSLIGLMTDLKFSEDKVEGIFLDEKVTVFLLF